jgi:uncharacterized membrane protein YjgN (DUF898 family)
VRREQYFHRNTLLDGSGFDYHGRPGAILKGRLIAYGAVVVFNMIMRYSFPLEHKALFLLAFALIAVTLLLPSWLLVRSFAFRTHNTSYRGLHFNFHGTYLKCVGTFLPYVLFYIAMLSATIFAMSFAKPKLLEIILRIPSRILFPIFFSFWSIPLFLMIPVIPALFCSFKRFQINNLSFGQSRFKCEVKMSAFYGIFFRTILIVIVYLVFYFLCFKLLRLFGGKLGTAFTLLVVLALFLLKIPLYFVVFVYLQVHTANLVWNNTTLGRHRFISTQTFKGLFALTASNIFLTLLTFGLYWPCAKMRLAAYRARNTLLVAEGGLDNFVGRVSEEVRATGEEILDVFDFDIAL